MMYPFLTLDDGTEIVHSEMLDDGSVKVYIEKADAKDGFHNAVCYLPSYRWDKINGFSSKELERYTEVITSTAHLIMKFSQEGGFDSTANLYDWLLFGLFLVNYFHAYCTDKHKQRLSVRYADSRCFLPFR